jgi:hypothetical protein
MSGMGPNQGGRLPEDRICLLGDGVAEVSLLLPGWQMAEMEQVAYSRGLTLGQLMRLLIREYLAYPGQADGGGGKPAGGQAEEGSSDHESYRSDGV